jgi:hypothetical protein
MQTGFEGIISKPTLALIGESGAENVSVHPVGEVQGGNTLILSPTINLQTGDVYGVDGVKELSRIIYAEISKQVRNEIKAGAHYTKGR